MDDEPTRPDTSTALAKDPRSGRSNPHGLDSHSPRADRFRVGDWQGCELLDVAFPERASLLDPRHTTLLMAIALVAVGVLSLLGAIIQHGLQLKALEQATYTYKAPLALSMVVAILLLVIGLLAVVGLILTIT